MNKSTIDEATIKRFLSKVIIAQDDQCWLWVGSKNTDGYGGFTLNKKNTGSHRASYIIYVGDIPKGMSVLHKCDVRNCVNPKHLFLGTQLDNVRDMFTKGRREKVTKGAFKKGVEHPRSKINDDIVREIRKLKKGRGVFTEFAKKHGISRTLVGYIYHGRAWQHVK
jgi:hypothetical protein